jgi:hypothetical protein
MLTEMFQALKTRLIAFSSKPLWQRRVAFGFLGAIGGFAYYYFIGCASGTCPISSNPYISTAYGILMGLLIPVQKKNGTPPEVESR